ncbi:MAG: hypothetical protein RLN80_01700, partial [Rhodospirillales bacterium]
MPSFWSTATVGLIAATTAAGVMASRLPEQSLLAGKPQATVYLPIAKKPQQQIPNAEIDIRNEPAASSETWVSEALKQARVVSDSAAPPSAPQVAPAATKNSQIAGPRAKPSAPPVAGETETTASLTVVAASAKATPAPAPASSKQTAKAPAPTGHASQKLAALRLQAKSPASATAAFDLSSQLRDAGARAVEWTEMLEWAADRGHTPSMYKLGTLFRDGEGVKKDTRFSRFWFEMAAAEGHIPSLHNLGIMLVEGKGGPKEPER